MIALLGLMLSAGLGQSQLPPLPPDLPSWIRAKGMDELYYKSAPYNWSINRIPKFARDMYATGVGHAMAYEAMSKGQVSALDTETFSKIDRVLRNPPKLPVDEMAISPTFVRKYGYLEKVFDWAHTLHFQTIDVLAYPGWSNARKEQELDELWSFYQSEPYALTGLPMNMEYLDGFSYSKRFRQQYPKLNGLFWGYHWLQTVNYDMLFGVPTANQAAQYEVLGERYHEVELYNETRDFMPMTAELSPRFAKRFPQLANAFDNLHMLHDNVNDILAQPGLTDLQREQQIQIAIYRVLDSTHRGESPGSGTPNTLHDHRHPPSMPGMGMMVGSEEDEMYMGGMGWMNMAECGHCSVPMPGEEPWGATVTANGWTMSVRCLMCARDMASETPGRAIIRASTEDPKQLLILVSDDEGNWTSNLATVVFLEKFGEHPDCSGWSRAFTSTAALNSYLVANPEYAGMPGLSLADWSKLNQGKPDTYRRIDRPNPYRKDGEE